MNKYLILLAITVVVVLGLLLIVMFGTLIVHVVDCASSGDYTSFSCRFVGVKQ